MHNNNLYQRVLNVPLIIHNAPRLKPQTIDALTYQNDISKLLENIRSNENTFKISTNKNRSIISACWYEEYCYSISKRLSGKQYKLIIYAIENTKELYNITDDPFETKNLAKAHAFPNNERIIETLEKELKNKITQNHKTYNDFYTTIHNDYMINKSQTFSRFQSVTSK
jgi:arylsulfatase A-like enzyme